MGDMADAAIGLIEEQDLYDDDVQVPVRRPKTRKKKAKKVKRLNKRAALLTWAGLNTALRNIDEEGARKLLLFEREGERRTQFLNRIYGKYNRLRGERERKELLSGK